MTFHVYATCLGDDGHTQYAPVGSLRENPTVGFLHLLYAVERQQVPATPPGWATHPRRLGWELWRVGFAPRPLAAATDAECVVECRPALYDLLGGAQPVRELHTWWTDTFYTLTYRPPSRATTVRSLTPADDAGTDLGSETAA